MRNMNALLIPNPFIFPPSGEDSTGEDPDGYISENEDSSFNYDLCQKDFINYTKTQFEIEWESASSSSESNLFDINCTNYFGDNLSLSPLHYYPSPPETPSSSEESMMESTSLTFEETDLNILQFEGQFQGQYESSMPLDTDLLTMEDPNFGAYFENAGAILGDAEIDETFGLFEPLNSKKIQEVKVLSDDMFFRPPIDESSSVLLTPVPLEEYPLTLAIENPPVAIAPVVQEEVIVTTQASAKRNNRKSSITTRHASASPSMEEVGPSYKVSIPKPSPRPIKVEEDVKNTKKRASKRSSATTDSAGSSKAKKQKVKMYELDDEACKNAKAARANREKKKQLMDTLHEENMRLIADNESKIESISKLELTNQSLQNELEQMKRKNLAAAGLKRVLVSAKDVLEQVMPPLIKKYGAWKVQAAPWFRKVDVSGVGSEEMEASLEHMNPTSNFITLHVNTSDRIVKVDYRPEAPTLPETMPQ